MTVTTVNVHEAKTQLSQLLLRISMGEEVVIAKAGKPVARLVPFAATTHAPRGRQCPRKGLDGAGFRCPVA